MKPGWCLTLEKSRTTSHGFNTRRVLESSCGSRIWSRIWDSVNETIPTQTWQVFILWASQLSCPKMPWAISEGTILCPFSNLRKKSNVALFFDGCVNLESSSLLCASYFFFRPCWWETRTSLHWRLGSGTPRLSETFKISHWLLNTSCFGCKETEASNLFGQIKAVRQWGQNKTGLPPAS